MNRSCGPEPGPGAETCCLCERSPFFQGRLEATNGSQVVNVQAAACGHHLGDMVHALQASARQNGVLHAQLIVLAVDPTSCHDSSTLNDLAPSGFLFSAIPIVP